MVYDINKKHFAWNTVKSQLQPLADTTSLGGLGRLINVGLIRGIYIFKKNVWK